jgi:hypothetical protein
MSRIASSVLERALVVVTVAGSGCAETNRASRPAATAQRETRVPVCKRATDRPPAGEAALEDRPDGTEVLVRYSATPRDAPCETLDVAFRLRGEMLVGEPGSQVEVVWTSERALDDGAGMTLLLGTATVALSSELERRGSRVALTARAPAAMLARYGSERRPTLVIAGRRIELSDRQTQHLRRFVRRLPFHAVGRPPVGGGRPTASTASTESAASTASTGRPRASIARPPVEADPAAGQGWFCVETAGDRKQRTSACHRTAAQCEESRAAMRAAGSQVGDCTRSTSAACFGWRGSAGRERACFHRLSHCGREKDRLEEEMGGVQTTDSCEPVP